MMAFAYCARPNHLHTLVWDVLLICKRYFTLTPTLTIIRRYSPAAKVGVRLFRAKIGEDNASSLALFAKLGYQQVCVWSDGYRLTAVERPCPLLSVPPRGIRIAIRPWRWLSRFAGELQFCLQGGDSGVFAACGVCCCGRGAAVWDVRMMRPPGGCAVLRAN